MTENLKQATKPVNLNPVQFSVLKLNKDFVTKKSEIPQEEIKKEVESIKKVLKKRAVEKKETAEAQFDSKTNQFKPKDGGLIDIETGLYVPPAKESKLDKKLNIYVEENVEEKISDSGDFVPPQGVKLDAKKGFVAENEEAEQKVAELNKEIAAQVVEPKKKPTFDELETDDDAYDKYFNYED